MSIVATSALTAKNLPGDGPRPKWLRVKLPYGKSYADVRSLVDQNKLHTVCESARCPNMGECWGAGTATFMILGNTCTRSCSFCAVATGRPDELDIMEPYRVATAVKKMNVKHAVITSVNRDEQKDSGMNIWAETVRQIRRLCPETTMETLIPDVKGRWEMLDLFTELKPEIVSHNMETVKRLYRRVRPQARYNRSLEQIQRTKAAGCRTKSGFMVGLGETVEEVYELMEDLVKHDCDVLTIGQYLQPTKMHLPVHEFIHPELFEHYQKVGMEMGFNYVESGPLVRSSYHSERHL
ncbi:lipoyl synthase [Pontibacter sp. G13]|uniref:lipoyl synthase n=1 Tax=Pontibacter sp. G13 TaxID=3074898 RepID=UPI00288AD0C8|nr:lipoyl synthase [Pontibacter sp. G13]WNJ16122.1 lipoyl synthase [Pontibacter sp. G13]